MRKYLKYVYLFIAMFCLVLFTGCNETVDELIINCDDVNVKMGETLKLNVSSNLKKANYEYSVIGESVEVNDGSVVAKKIGVSSITIKVDGYDETKTINAYVYGEGLTIFGKDKQTIETEEELILYKDGVDEDEKITWKSSNTDIARVSKGVVTGVGLGNVTISAKSDLYSFDFELEIIRPIATELTVEDNLKYEVGSNYNLVYSVAPKYSLEDLKIEADNDSVIIDENNNIKANKVGKVNLKVTSLSNTELVKNVQVEVLTKEAPKFIFANDYQNVATVEYGDLSPILYGITAIDNADGDVTSKITFDEEEAYKYGERNVRVTVTDNAGNTASFDRKVNVTWQYHTKFIGHSGSLYGVPNTEEAFLYAAKVLHYQAMECDLHVTKDGIFVTNHDSTIKIGEETYSIENSNYEDLAKLELTHSKYSGHICTFQRYLEICKEYGMEAIVELKWTTGINSSDTSNMQKLVDFVKKYGDWENTVFLTSMEACLSWFRIKGYNDVRLQVLKNTSDSQATLDFCVKYNVDLSINVTYSDKESTDEWLKKYHDAGLEISTWTFSSTSEKGYAAVQTWIDKGVEYITSDVHILDKLELK